ATADAVALARGAGVVVVAAAGNDDADVSGYSPAGEPGVIAVGATDLAGRRAWYSNSGSALDVAAPGGDLSADRDANGRPDGVLSLSWGSGGRQPYATEEGTSMAAPHVAGIVALMRAVHPALTPDALDALLAGAKLTRDLGAPGWDPEFGAGLLDANLAVLAAAEAASEPVPDVPVLRASSDRLDFGSTLTTLPLTLENAGRGTLDVTAVTADAAWVTVSPAAAGMNDVLVDRTGLPSGTHTATLTVTSNGGSATVSVRVTVGTPPPAGGDLGPVYVVLVAPGTSDVLAQTIARASQGYAFAFRRVPPGSYDLLAGTDLDGNGVINDEGEAFGAYPVTSDPRPLQALDDVRDVTFPLRLLSTFTAARRSPLRR
ncbi:MAG: S8 family serine peptidase, partial [Deltaproteobacteria bacterium]|nr:S8 family serine peptidase [Deltaproteobacteria bacterium]